MKRLIPVLLLVGSTILTGCGDSNNDYTQVSGQQGNPAPIVTPTPTSAYFVDATNGNDTTAAANPTSNTPFKTIQAAVTSAPTNTTITVRAGTYTETVTLKDGQRLLGVAGGNRPVLSGSIVLADGNTVDFLQIQDSQGDSINGDNQNGGTVSNCEIVSPGNDGVSLVSSIGNWTISGNTVSGAQNNGFGIVHEADGSLSARIRVEGNTFTNNDGDAIGFLCEDNAQVTARIADNIMTGNFPGSTVEIIVSNSSTFELDLEDNQNDDFYVLGISSATATFNVEQLSVLTNPRPGGAGNTGTVDIAANPGASITEVPDGTLGF